MFNWLGLPQWQIDLIHKYPDIYLTPNPRLIEQWKSDKQFFCNLRYGFEFQQGWKELVEEFSQTTTQLVQKLRESGLQPDAFVRSCIFKQKFARLTWQGSNNLPEPFGTIYRGYINDIESRSTCICELTGKPGQIRSINHYLCCLSDAEYLKKAGLKKLPDEGRNLGSRPRR